MTLIEQSFEKNETEDIKTSGDIIFESNSIVTLFLGILIILFSII